MKENVVVKKKRQTGGRDPVWPIAEHLILQRVNTGMARYGEPLLTYNGIDPGEMAIEEIIDALLYTVQLKVQYDDALARIRELEDMLREAGIDYE